MGGEGERSRLTPWCTVQYRGWDGVSSSVGVEMRWKRERVGGLRGFGGNGGVGVLCGCFPGRQVIVRYGRCRLSGGGLSVRYDR